MRLKGLRFPSFYSQGYYDKQAAILAKQKQFAIISRNSSFTGSQKHDYVITRGRSSQLSDIKEEGSNSGHSGYSGDSNIKSTISKSGGFGGGSSSFKASIKSVPLSPSICSIKSNKIAVTVVKGGAGNSSYRPVDTERSKEDEKEDDSDDDDNEVMTVQDIH